MGGGGTPFVGSRCVATPSEDMNDLARAVVNGEKYELVKRF
jgi:hypothetical protein